MKYCEVCNIKMHHNREDDLKEAWQNHLGGIKHQQNLIHVARSKKMVMLTGVTPMMSCVDIKSYFSKFGKVEMVNKHKFMARVQFVDVADMEKAVAQPSHVIGGQQVHATIFLGTFQYQAHREPRTEMARRWQNRIDIQYRVLLNPDIEDQILGLLTEMELDEKIKQKMKEYTASIQTFLQNYIPEVRLYQFGSSMTGLGSKDCNLNLMMDLDPKRGKAIRKNPQAASPDLPDLSHLPKLKIEGGRVTLESLVNMTIGEQMFFFILLLEESPERQRIKEYLPMFAARLPMLRIWDSFRKWDISLAFGDKLSVYNTHLIRLLIELDGRFGIIAHIIKFWAWQVGMSSDVESLSLPSYCLTLLVYFFLENTSPPVLPTVKDLCDLAENFPLFKATRGSVAGWNITICEDVEYIRRRLLPEKNMETIPELVRGFFEFYANLDLLNVVICPRTGLAIGTLMFRETMKTNEKIRRFQLKDISIQEPYDLSHNTAESLQPSSVRDCISLEFIKAAEAIDHVEQRGEAWTLATILPEEPVLVITGMSHRDLTKQRGLKLADIQVPYRPALLPDLFLENYSSAEEISSQWFQWIVELSMQVLGVFRADYQVTEGYDKVDDDLTLHDIEYIAHMDTTDDGKARKFNSAETLKKEVVLVCKSHVKVAYTQWQRKLTVGIKENNVDVSTAEKLLGYAEKVSEMLTPAENPCTEEDSPTLEFVLVCRMLTVGHNTFARFYYIGQMLLKTSFLKCLQYLLPRVLSRALNQENEDDEDDSVDS